MTDSKLNKQITAQTVQLISEDGEKIGICSLYSALDMADQKGLDLVQVSDDVIPFCKIMDYNKVKYKKSKKRKNNNKIVVKEIKFGFNIAQHDMDVKINHIRKFLSKKYHVRFTLELVGRFRNLTDESYIKFKKYLDEMSDIAVYGDIIKNDKGISTILKPI